MRIVCPRCDGQGRLRRVRINATGQPILLCDECEAVWLSERDVTRTPWVDFRTHMAQFGLTGLWSEITELPEDNPPIT